MATNVKKTSGNYVDSAYAFVVDSSGNMVGGTATAPSAGDQDGSAMYRLTGIKDFPFQPTQADRPTQLGDGGALVRFVNKSPELPEGVLTVGARDLTFTALLETLVARDVAGGTFLGRNPKNPTFRDIGWVVQSPAKSLDSGSENAAHWEGIMVYKTNGAARGRNSFNTNSLPDYNYDIVGNRATQFPWGVSFTALLDGDTEFVFSEFTWPYRFMMQRFTGDGIETDFNLAHTLAEDSVDNLALYINGTPATWVTGVPGAGEFGADASTGVISLGTAPASNGIVVCLYGVTA